MRPTDLETSANEKIVTAPKKSRHATTGRATATWSGIDQETEGAGENYGEIISYSCHRKDWKRPCKYV